MGNMPIQEGLRSESGLLCWVQEDEGKKGDKKKKK